MTLAPDASLRDLARRPLFEPLRALLESLPDGTVPAVAALDRLLHTSRRRPVAASGMPLSLVAPHPSTLSYEERVYERGEVATRAGSWHDFFNVAVWLTFPRAKAALNARHYFGIGAERVARSAVRGAPRDAATQFDECGVVVASADAALSRGLRAHAWKHVLWVCRSELRERARFFVFGHATYDALRRPYYGLCGKAIYLDVAPSWLALDPAPQSDAVDAWLAETWSDPRRFIRPQELAPLPLLGIPGVVEASADPRYYDDTHQFRPKRMG